MDRSNTIELPRGKITISGTSEYAAQISVGKLSHHIAIAEKLITPSATVLDVGANIGVTALLMAQYATHGSVHAFEPHPKTYSQLLANIARNGSGIINAYPYGLGEKHHRSLFRDEDRYNSGNAQISDGSTASSAFNTIEVEIRRSADVLSTLPSVDFMKIDVEGYEIDVLRGCGDRLNSVAAVFMEFNPWCLTMYRRMLPEDAIEEICKTFRYVIPLGAHPKPIHSDQEKMRFLHEAMVAKSMSDLVCTNHEDIAFKAGVATTTPLAVSLSKTNVPTNGAKNGSPSLPKTLTYLPNRERPLRMSAGTLTVEIPAVVDQINFRGPLNTFGAFSYGNTNTTIYSSDVGRYCSIAHEVMIAPFEHPTDRLSTHPFTFGDTGTLGYSTDFMNIASREAFNGNSARTFIGNDVWIGCRAFIRRGIKVGHGAIIAAHATVVSDVAPFTIVGGTPAKPIRMRFREDLIKRILEAKWWDYDLSPIARQAEPFSDIERALDIIETAIANNNISKLTPLTRKFINGTLAQG